MGSDRTGTRLRGLLVPLPRSLWVAQSGEYDAGGTRLSPLISAGPVCEVPVPGQTTDLALRAHGEPTSDVWVRCLRGGLPGQDEAGMLWSDTSATASQRGCDLPSRVAHYDPIYSGGTRYHPHVVATEDGGEVVAYYQAGTGTVVRDTTGTEHTIGPDGGFDTHPCLLLIPGSGRLHCYHWSTTGAGDWQIRLHTSDDDGVTWSSSTYVLDAALDPATYDAVYRLRAAYVDGMIVLLAHLHLAVAGVAGDDVIGQWASSDGGQTLYQVEIWDGSVVRQVGGYPDVAVLSGVIYVAWLGDPAGAARQTVSLARLGTAWERLSYVDYIQPTAGVVDDLYTAGPPMVSGELAILASDDGALYLTVRHVTDGSWSVLRSPDSGATLTRTGPSAASNGCQQWHDVGTLLETPAELSAVEIHGRVVCWHGLITGGAVSGHLHRTSLGGHTTVTLPHVDGVMLPTYRTAYEESGYLWTVPTTWGWVLAVGAAGVVAGDITTLQAVSTHTRAGMAGTIAQGMIWEVQGRLAQVGVGNQVYWQVRVSNGAADYTAEVRIANTQVQLYDVNAGAVIATLADGPGVARYRLLIAVAGSSAQAWILTEATDAEEDRVWTLIGQTDTLVAGAAAAHRLQVQAILDTEWHWTGHSSGAYTGDQLVSTRTYSDLYPRPIRSDPVYMGEGVSVSAVTGPAVYGDTWEIGRTYEYPPEALDPIADASGYYASPAWEGRSRDVADFEFGTTQLRISWILSTSDEYQESDLLGIYADGSNLPPGSAIYLYYAAAWHLVATLTADSVDVVAAGDTLRVDTAAGAVSGDTVYRRDELAGADVRLNGGGGTTCAVASNAPGSTDLTATRPLVMRLDDSPAAAGQQLCTIWPPRWLAVIRLSAYSRTISGIQIRIPVGATTTPSEGYYRAGIVVTGEVWAWGWEYSHGRSIQLDPQIEVYEAEDGSELVEVRGSPRRAWEVSWSDEVSTCTYYDTTDPDYVLDATGGDAVAYWGDTPLDVLDQFRALQGALTPVVYLPRIDVDDLLTGSVFYRQQWAMGAIYSRIHDIVAIDSVRGDEEETETLKLQRVTGKEVL